LLLAPPLIAIVLGWLVAPNFLHPARRSLTPDLVQQADASFGQIGAHREALDVRAPDGVLLHGWKIRSAHQNGSWVLLFHGVADNRMGIIEHSLFLLRAGYSVTLMDAHGESEGPFATYGWLEANDTRAILDELIAAEHPEHIFALGESMGAGIALQSAAADSRIEAVVAEAPFASLREASYDYAGLQKYPLLGKTLFAPGAWVMLTRGQALASFPSEGVSPARAVASRAFPVFLICDAEDTTLPCRHAEKIYTAASGPKSLWIVPEAYHTAALGYQPNEFRRRVLNFFADPARKQASSAISRGISESLEK
jgi:alpha-beta hydrolase superfamily lysophospholipase